MAEVILTPSLHPGLHKFEWKEDGDLLDMVWSVTNKVNAKGIIEYMDRSGERFMEIEFLKGCDRTALSAILLLELDWV